MRVVAVEGADALARRLQDHGLWPGAVAELLTVAIGGDPLLFRLHGYRLALRREEAMRVLTDPVADAPGADAPAGERR